MSLTGRKQQESRPPIKLNRSASSTSVPRDNDCGPKDKQEQQQMASRFSGEAKEMLEQAFLLRPTRRGRSALKHHHEERQGDHEKDNATKEDSRAILKHVRFDPRVMVKEIDTIYPIKFSFDKKIEDEVTLQRTLTTLIAEKRRKISLLIRKRTSSAA